MTGLLTAAGIGLAAALLIVWFGELVGRASLKAPSLDIAAEILGEVGAEMAASLARTGEAFRQAAESFRAFGKTYERAFKGGDMDE